VIVDLFRKKPDADLQPAEAFDAAGVLDASSTRALPEASVTTLVVVDEDEDESDILAADEDEEYDDDGDGSDDDDDDDDSSSKSKSSRWGRDAGSKAG